MNTRHTEKADTVKAHYFEKYREMKASTGIDTKKAKGHYAAAARHMICARWGITQKQLKQIIGENPHGL